MKSFALSLAFITRLVMAHYKGHRFRTPPKEGCDTGLILIAVPTNVPHRVYDPSEC